MKIYIAGPMRGYPNFNRDAFNDMAEWLTAKGYEVFNPIAIDVEEYGTEIHNSPTGSIVDVGKFGMTAQNVLARDAKLLASADAIYLLTGWEKSTGAQAEWAMARAMGLQIFYQAGIEDYEWKEHFDGASN